MSRKVTVNDKGVDKYIEQYLKTEGVERMRRVKDASNSDLMHETQGESGIRGDDYVLSVEGRKRLRRKDMVTVITASAAAMIDNAKNDTLIRNHHLAGGE